jgi:hypothetical protein
MLSEFFDSRARIRALRDGPAGALFDGFAQALSQAGYAKLTARLDLRAAEHFIHWVHRNGMAVPELNEQYFVRFDRYLGRCRCRYRHADRMNVLHGARCFLRYLRDCGIIGVFTNKDPIQDPVLLSAFCRWMRDQRGTCGKPWIGIVNENFESPLSWIILEQHLPAGAALAGTRPSARRRSRTGGAVRRAQRYWRRRARPSQSLSTCIAAASDSNRCCFIPSIVDLFPIHCFQFGRFFTPREKRPSDRLLLLAKQGPSSRPARQRPRSR